MCRTLDQNVPGLSPTAGQPCVGVPLIIRRLKTSSGIYTHVGVGLLNDNGLDVLQQLKIWSWDDCPVNI